MVPLVHGQRVERRRVRSLELPRRPIELALAFGDRRLPVPQQRVVVAARRLGERRRVVLHVPAPPVPVLLGRHPKQRCRIRVRLQRGARCGQELIVDRRAVAVAGEQHAERLHREVDPARSVVTVRCRPVEGLSAELGRKAPQRRHGMRELRVADGIAFAREDDAVVRRLIQVAPPRVPPLDRVGGVERHGPHPIGMTDREGLREEGAVGIAVQVDLLDPQRVEHPGEVVGCERSAVALGHRPERLGAVLLGDVPRLGVVILVLHLELVAHERIGASGSAQIHQQEVVVTAQRTEELHVPVAGGDRRVAGATLDRDDRPSGGILRRRGAERARRQPSSCRASGTEDRPAPGHAHKGHP